MAATDILDVLFDFSTRYFIESDFPKPSLWKKSLSTLGPPPSQSLIATRRWPTMPLPAARGSFCSQCLTDEQCAFICCYCDIFVTVPRIYVQMCVHSHLKCIAVMLSERDLCCPRSQWQQVTSPLSSACQSAEVHGVLVGVLRSTCLLAFFLNLLISFLC